jgi:hypothetical protein
MEIERGKYAGAKTVSLDLSNPGIVGSGSTVGIPRVISEEDAIAFMDNTIKTILGKFREGEIQWPELGLSKIKQFLLKRNSLFTPDILVGVLSSVATAVATPALTYLGVHEGLIPIGQNTENIVLGSEAVASILLGIYVYDKIQDRVKEIFVSWFEGYNESALVDKIKGITPADKQRNLENYRHSFDLLKEYFGQNPLEFSTLKQLEEEVRVDLQKLGRYARVGQNAYDVVVINEDWDESRPEGEINQGPLISMNAVLILVLKELSDQNPKSLKRLEEKWGNDEKKRDIKWAASPKEKPRISADIFLEALKQVKLMNEQLQKLLEEKIIEKDGSGEIPELAIDEFLDASKEKGTYDSDFLDRLFERIGDDKGRKERKDIITARFFIGAYSRLRQMGDNIEKGDDVPLGYATRLVNNTKHMVRILDGIKQGSQKYGLTERQIEFMVAKLREASEKIEKALPKDAAQVSQERKGGIDLTPANMNLQTKNNGGEITFHLDPAMLQQLQNAPGFVPVIINIQPLNDLRQFLYKEY